MEHRGRVRRRRCAARSTGYAANNADDAEKLLEGIFTNVTVMDKSANDSLKNFQSGNGDVAISYENQILLSKAGGKEDALVSRPPRC